MRKFSIIILLLTLLVVPASGKTADIGGIIGSAIGGVAQLAQAAKEITPAEEHYIGRAVAAMLLVKYPLLNNAALTKYVNEVGLLVALASDRPSTYGGYHFAVLDADEVNAYACPGGLIFVNKGLLKKLQNEDQLAAVLGHEVAHVAQRDGINTIKKTQWTNLAFYAAGEVARNYTSGEASQLVGVFQGVVTDVAKKVIDSGYSQGDEKKADEFGMRYMSVVGYNPAEMVGFMNGMAAASSGKGGPFSSHPKPEVRVSLTSKLLASLGEGKTEAIRTQRYKGAVASVK